MRPSIQSNPETGTQAAICHSSAEIRANIVSEAEKFLDSAYKWGSVEPYKGSHCAEFALTPYRNTGLIDSNVRTPAIHRDWLMGKNVDPNTFRNFITQFAVQIPFDSRQIADLVTFEFDGVESHAAIIVRMGPDYIIHNPSGMAAKFQKLMNIPSLVAVYRHKKIMELDNGRT